jgi:hypothetical protein
MGNGQWTCTPKNVGESGQYCNFVNVARKMWLWGGFCLQMGVTRIILLTTNRQEENGTRNGNLNLKFERYGKAPNPALFYSLGDITWIDFLYPADG